MEGNSELTNKNEIENSNELVPERGKKDLINRFLDNQAKELSLRSEELVLKKQEDNNAFAYGKEALGKKIDDRKDQRIQQKELRKLSYIFSGFIILLVIALIIVCLSLDKEAIALELVKAIVYVAGGALGGYGFAANKKTKSSQSKQD